MNYSQFKKRAKHFLRKQLSLTHYIDVQAAEENIRQNIPFRGPNIYILFVAIVIASVGLNVNSIPVIIGAMLISPLMSPIIGFGMGLGTNDAALIIKSLKHLSIMFVVSLIASTLYFMVTPLEMENPTELLARTNPSVYDVLIAFFGGIAGILELSRKEKGTVLSGVAIATALMPPLCTVGYGIANWSWHYASGALYLFFINCVFIALATYLAAKYLHFPSKVEAKSYRRLIIYVLLILVVLIPSFFSAYNIVCENQFTNAARHFVKENQAIGGTYIYDYSTDLSDKPYTLTLRLAGEQLSNEQRAYLYAEAEKNGISHTQIRILEDATIEVRRLNETEVMKDWLASTEAQLQQRDDSIRVLNKQLDVFKAQQLPVEQITSEVQTQWPQITSVTLARNEKQIVLLVQAEPALNEDDQQRISSWLSVRLQADNVLVVAQSTDTSASANRSASDLQIK